MYKEYDDDTKLRGRMEARRLLEFKSMKRRTMLTLTLAVIVYGVIYAKATYSIISLADACALFINALHYLTGLHGRSVMEICYALPMYHVLAAAFPVLLLLYIWYQLNAYEHMLISRPLPYLIRAAAERAPAPDISASYHDINTEIVNCKFLEPSLDAIPE